MNADYNKKTLLQKFFLDTYFIVFITIFFLRDSNIIMVLSSSTINHIYYLMLFCGIVVNFIIMIYLDINLNCNISNIIISIFFICAFTVPLFFSGKLLPLVFVFFILTALNSRVVNPNTFIKTDFYMRVSLVILTVSLMILHVLPSYVTFRNGNSRYNFGFSGPNAFAVVILSIFLSYSLINHKSHNHLGRSVIILLCIYIIVCLLTNTRQLLILGIVFICFYYLNNLSNCKILMNIISKILLIITTVFSIIISVAFVYNPNINNPFFYWLNSVSSDRVLIESQTLLDYPIRLIGYKSMPLIGLKGENIDNLFASDLIHCGILGFIIIIVAILYYIIKSLRYGNRFTNVSIIIILLAFLTIYTDELYTPLIYIASLAYYKNKTKILNL